MEEEDEMESLENRLLLVVSPQGRLGHSDVRQHMTPSPWELWLLRFPTGGLTPVNNVIAAGYG